MNANADHFLPDDERSGIDRVAEALALPGAGSFPLAISGREGGARQIAVYFYRPVSFSHDAPILIVMHGTKRNAADYRDTWTTLADRGRCLVVCPEFTKRAFHRTAFQLGGMVDADGSPRPRRDWTFGVIEQLFDVVREATGNASSGYHLYGHSAGSQFVHRLALFLPEARFKAAVAANAGWYTMPTPTQGFPYGLAETGISADDLLRALGRRLIVVLGERDVHSDDPYLRNSSGARRQGQNRFERGLAFYAAAQVEAARRGVPLAWELVTVPGAAHVDGEMAPAAARALFAPR